MLPSTAVLVYALAFATQADPAADPGLIDRYQEPDSWNNRANFYVGARAGVAIPSGAKGVAESGGLEIGVANDFGFGFGLHALWMNQPPGAPLFNVPPSRWGLGAMADLRFYFPTVEPLTLYPTLSAGFVAGPSALDGTNAVLPLIDPGIGARVKFGSVYVAFEFGFAGFSVPYVNLCFGFQGDRKQERAEKWAREQRAEAMRRPVLEEPAARPVAHRPAPDVTPQSEAQPVAQPEAQPAPQPQPEPEQAAPTAKAPLRKRSQAGAPSRPQRSPGDPDVEWTSP